MLTPLAYETLRRFHQGEEVGDIAGATGQPWMQVRNIINVHADGKRVKALEIVNRQKPPTDEEIAAAIAAQSPLTAPIAKPAKAKKDRATEVPERLREEPVPADSPHPRGEVAPVASGTAGVTPPEPSPIRTAIKTMGEVIRTNPYDPYALAAISLAEQASTGGIIVPADDLTTMDGVHLAALDIPDLRDAAIALGNQAAELRSKVVEHRRQAAVKARIAELEAELAQLREMAA